MGNAIAKKLDLPKDHTATAGHVSNFKIWPAKNKETQQLVSLWAFDKNELMKRKEKPVTDKSVAEQLFQIMKKDMTLLKDCGACSSIIQIIEVIEDSKNVLAFTTERIICSLADILNNCENIPNGISMEHLSFFEAEKTVSEMEISRGLLNITNALQYLHTVQHKLHLNITPESIVITESGQWKLCGFGFHLSFEQGDIKQLASPYFLKSYPSTVHNTVQRLEPDLRYASPECTDGGMNPPGIRYLTAAVDMFSLGMVFYEIYAYNLKLSSYERSYYRPTIPVTHNDVNQHHLALQALHKISTDFLPIGIQQLLNGLLNLNPQIRFNVNDVMNHQYYTSGTLLVLNTIDILHTKDLGTKSSQMISLQHQLSDFPARVLMYSILPKISFLCVEEPQLWVYALPIHIYVQRQLPGDQYKNKAYHYIAKGLNVNDCNECIQAFLANIEFISKTFGKEFFQTHASKLFSNALERSNIYLQNLAFEKLAEFEIYPNFDEKSLSETLIPQLCKDACKHPETMVKIQALYIISLLIKKLDETFIANNILPSLKYINDHEKNPMVSMCVVGNYEAISNSLGPEYLATSILPVIQGMLLDRGLDRQQFEMLVNMVKRMLKRILTIRTEELGIPPISVAEVPGSDRIDPFEGAREVIANTKRKNQANNYGLGTIRSKEPPPPVPSTPPPPPPGGAPPVPMVPPIDQGQSSDTLDMSKMSLGGVTLSAAGATSSSNLGLPPPPPVPPVPVPLDGLPVTSQAQPSNSAGLLGSIDVAGLDTIGASTTSIPSVSATENVSSTDEDSGKPQRKSWFSFSSSSKAPQEKTVEYTPPQVPTGTQFKDDFTGGAGAPSVANTNDTIPDMDDFLQSFGKTANTVNNPPVVASMPPKQGLVPPAGATGTSSTQGLSIEEQIRQTQQEIARLSGTMNTSTSTGSFNSAPVVGSTASAPVAAPAPTPPRPAQSFVQPPAASTGIGASSGGLDFSGMNMHSSQQRQPQPVAQQYQQPHTQQQYVQQQPQQQQSQFTQVPQQQQPFHQQGQQYAAPTGYYSNPSGPQVAPRPQFGAPQAYQPQGYGQQPHPMQGYGNMQMHPGYGSAPMYMQQQQPPPQQQQRFFGGGASQPTAGMNTNRIGTLPPQTGYQPPSVAQPMPSQQQQNKRGSVDSAFDFLG